MPDLHLTPAEEALLAGSAGPGVQKAMQIVVALGRIYAAPDLTPITHAQISGVSYKNLGDAGVDFLNHWAAEGASVRVPTTLNPAGMELERWQEMGISPDFARPQLIAISAFRQMGVTPTMSCTPYLFPGIAPRRGDHLAWAESSAVVWANSVVGAYTNREGGPSALAAAIVGRTARYGSDGATASLASATGSAASVTGSAASAGCSAGASADSAAWPSAWRSSSGTGT